MVKWVSLGLLVLGAVGVRPKHDIDLDDAHGIISGDVERGDAAAAALKSGGPEDDDMRYPATCTNIEGTPQMGDPQVQVPFNVLVVTSEHVAIRWLDDDPEAWTFLRAAHENFFELDTKESKEYATALVEKMGHAQFRSSDECKFASQVENMEQLSCYGLLRAGQGSWRSLRKADKLNPFVAINGPGEYTVMDDVDESHIVFKGWTMSGMQWMKQYELNLGLMHMSQFAAPPEAPTYTYQIKFQVPNLVVPENICSRPPCVYPRQAVERSVGVTQGVDSSKNWDRKLKSEVCSAPRERDPMRGYLILRCVAAKDIFADKANTLRIEWFADDGGADVYEGEFETEVENFFDYRAKLENGASTRFSALGTGPPLASLGRNWNVVGGSVKKTSTSLVHKKDWFEVTLLLNPNPYDYGSENAMELKLQFALLPPTRAETR